MPVHIVCITMHVEMHGNTATQILPLCLMLDLVQGVFLASPLLSRSKTNTLMRISLCGPAKCDFICVRQFVAILPS